MAQIDAVHDLRPAGRCLFDDLHEDGEPYSLTVMILEAARIKDRLDRLDTILRGDVDTWAVLVHDLRTEDYELRIDGAAVEARQQANTLRQLLIEVRRQKGDGGGSDGDDGLDGL